MKPTRSQPAAPPRGFQPGATVTLRGTIERITFENPDSGYMVARFRTGNTSELITLVGPLGGIQKGEELEVTGSWESDPRYGAQLQVRKFAVQTPTSGAGLRDYLTTFKNIGGRRADALVEDFGEELATVIEEDPTRLCRIKGISRPMAMGLQREWKERFAERQVMVFCQSFGITANQARRIYKTYGDRALKVLNREGNPYRLAEDVFGIGFKKADEIAQKLGIAADDPRRIEAALIFSLQRGADDGHTFLPCQRLFTQALEEVPVPEADLLAGLEALIHAGRVVPDPAALEHPDSAEPLTPVALHTLDAPIYLPLHHRTEVAIATDLAQRLQGFQGTRALTPEEETALERQLSRQQIALSPAQQEAIREAIVAPVFLLTGGPGTGKSTCLRLAVDLLEASRAVVTLCAPTGRAAKRISETTGREALTIHRLLEYQPSAGGFQRDAENPLATDVVIIDEVSMLDAQLCAALLRALPAKSRLILVGDPDQLPSVGAGNVLADCIAAEVVPRAHLREIFRQAQTSQIVVNAHRINEGQMPEFTPPPGQKKDFVFRSVTEDKEAAPAAAAALVLQAVCKGRETGKFNPIRDVQVLTPMHNGPVGARALNLALQEALNPVRNPRQVLKLGGREFRVGDRVMQTRNNYDKDIYNGDIGFILDIDSEEGLCTIQFDFPVTYKSSELDELLLAYAITVHKSQGSEFPIVVLPLVSQHFMMLRRNLLYTALTRAKKVAILIGQRKAVWIAVQRGSDTSERRFTGLATRLVRTMQGPAPPAPAPKPRPAAVTGDGPGSASDRLYRRLVEPPFAVHRFAKLTSAASASVIYVSKGAKVAVILDPDPEDPRLPHLVERDFTLLRFPASQVLTGFEELESVLLSALE